MSETDTAPAPAEAVKAEAPFGDSLETFFDHAYAKPAATETTPESETPAQDASTTETDQQASGGEESPKPAKKAKGPPRPVNLEQKIKGLEKGFYKASRENAELRKEIQALKGEPMAEREHDPEVIATQARRDALERASYERAVEEFGEDHIKAQIFDEDAPYRRLVEGEGKKWIRDRVLASSDPIYEALKVIQEEDLLDRYGRDIETVKHTLKEELKADVLKELRKDASQVGKKVPSLSTARMAGTQPQQATTNAPDINAINPAFNLSAIA